MTNKLPASKFGESLLSIIASKDAQKSVAAIQEFNQHMRDPAVGADYVMWISEPINLSRIQKSITDDLGVHPRAMMIKRVLMSRTQRAVLLIQAMEIAIKRQHQL